VFSRTKHGANRLASKLQAKGIEASALHGNKSQGARTKALAGFKTGDVRVLVATDIAARGIDISLLPHVVNFDLPQVPEDYVHRIGRTGRAGAEGEAISLVSHDEYKQLIAIERLIKKLIPRQQLDGYEPLNALPESKADFRDKKPKKPKRKKQPQAGNSKNGQRAGGSRSRANRGKANASRKKRSGNKSSSRKEGAAKASKGRPDKNSQ
jgi:ATP-dependent RNA helicase RhlE